jgi:hypothetical protein
MEAPMSRSTAFFVGVLVLAVSGCSTPLGTKSVLVPANNPEAVGRPATQPLPGASTVLSRNVTAQDCAQNIFWIPWGPREPDLNAAVTQAVARVPGGLMMTNVSVAKHYMISGLYNVDCIRVTGDVVGK